MATRETARLSHMPGRTHVGRDQFLGVSRPQFGDGEIDELAGAIRSGWVTTGPKVSVLQDRLADYVGAPYVRCLSSCTAGLTLALHVLGVGPATRCSSRR